MRDRIETQLEKLLEDATEAELAAIAAYAIHARYEHGGNLTEILDALNGIEALACEEFLAHCDDFKP